jgi:hypothetical protein
VRALVVDLLIVIDVVYFNFKALGLFEVEVDHDLGHELGVEIIVDDFSLTKFLPLTAMLLVQDTEWV